MAVHRSSRHQKGEDGRRSKAKKGPVSGAAWPRLQLGVKCCARLTTKGTKPLRVSCTSLQLASKGSQTQISVPSTQFAVVTQYVPTTAGPYLMRLWRWDEAAKSLKFWKDAPTGWQVNAASSKWVVLAGMEQDTSTTTPTSRLEAQVWNGSKWTAVTSLKQPSYARLQALVAVPPGGALVALGGVNENYGLWRLVA